MKIEGEFYVKDFFGDFENGMDTFIESIKEGNLPLSECMAAAIVTVITSNYNYDMEKVYDWIDDNGIIERVMDTQCNNVTMQDILNEWNKFMN